MKFFTLVLIFVGLFLGFSNHSFGFEPKFNDAPLSYFGYFDEDGNKVTQLQMGKEYQIKAKFSWPQSYSQPYEFFAEINDDKHYRVLERFTSSGTLKPNQELEVVFFWTPTEVGKFRNFSELWTIDKSTVITGVPQYDIEVVSNKERTNGGSIVPDKTIFPTPWEKRPPLKQFNDGIDPKVISCNEGLVLIQKYNGYPACVKHDSIAKLIKRGWAKS